MFKNKAIGDERGELFVSQITAAKSQEPEQPAMVEVQPEPEVEEEVEEPEAEEPQEDEQVKADLMRWKRKARRAFGTDEAFQFTDSNIPPELHAQIVNGIKAAKSADELETVFSKARTAKVVNDDSAIRDLARIIEEAIVVSTKAEPVQQMPNINVTMPQISLTAQMPPNGSVIVNVPEQPAPVVNVTTPQQPAPVVNVTNEPAQNNINVQPADVILPALPMEAEITTDYQGKKTLKVKK
jgi:hypothetical protein